LTYKVNTRRDANARRYRPPFSARYYDSFSLSFSSCCVVVFNGVYEREREQLIELQQSRVKANTNRELAARDDMCYSTHADFSLFLLVITIPSLVVFVSSSCYHHHFFFFSVRIYLWTTPLFLSVPNISLFRLSLIRSLR
jgi:hypothetical protein